MALFEAAKGVIVLLVGFGMLGLLHRDSRVLAGRLIAWLNLNPTRRYSEVFLQVASQITDTRLWMIAGFAAVYSAFRLFEAYGLWKQRSWAEWLAVVSGTIYIPVEVFELVEKVTWVRAGALVTNLLVVGFMVFVLRKNAAAKKLARLAQSREAAVAAEAGPPPAER